MIKRFLSARQLNIRTCLSVACFICNTVFSTTYAQKRFDLFYAEGSINKMPPTVVNEKNNFETALMLNASIPLLLKDSLVIITITDYQNYYIGNEYNLSDSNAIKQFNLHGIIIRAGYIKRLNQKFSLQALVIPRLMTDYNAPLNKSLQFGGMLTLENSTKKDFLWRAGLLFNQDFFGPFLIPVFYLDASFTKRIKFTGLLPVYGKLFYQVNEKTTAGIHLVGLTTSYRLSETGYENYYVERNSIDISMFGNVPLYKNIFLQARIGYSFNKDYGLYAENQKVDLALPLKMFGDNRVRANNTFQSSPFFSLRLQYSVPIK